LDFLPIAHKGTIQTIPQQASCIDIVEDPLIMFCSYTLNLIKVNAEIASEVAGEVEGEW
jgi:hypothetical protein